MVERWGEKILPSSSFRRVDGLNVQNGWVVQGRTVPCKLSISWIARIQMKLVLSSAINIDHVFFRCIFGGGKLSPLAAWIRNGKVGDTRSSIWCQAQRIKVLLSKEVESWMWET